MEEKKLLMDCHYTIDNTLEMKVYTEVNGKQELIIKRVFDRGEFNYRNKLFAFCDVLKAHFDGYEVIINDWYD